MTDKPIEIVTYVCGGMQMTVCPKDRKEHQWDGPVVEFEAGGGGTGASVTCSKCGLDAMTHDMMVGP